MNDVRELHERAMDLAQQAEGLRGGDPLEAFKLFAEAFALEKRAAEGVTAGNGSEPARSILLRSAAALGVECGEYQAAENLIQQALAGSPPADVRRDLSE